MDQAAVTSAEASSEVLVVICNPRAASLCHAAASRCVDALVAAGRSPLVHDLYREAFDPVATAEELDRGFSFDEQVQIQGEELRRARGLILVHPDWWGQPPAMLKGWVDRVFRPGVAYEVAGGDGSPTSIVPLLGGKRAMVVATTDAARPPATLSAVWREGVFSFCGIDDVRVMVHTDTRASTAGGRSRWLDEVGRAVEDTFATDPDGPCSTGSFR